MTMQAFEFLKARLDICQVVGNYLTLKKLGAYLKASCPFHSEKDASFTVSPSRQIFYCFGCKKGGDVIAFIAELENLTPMQALEQLAEDNKIVIPEELLSTTDQGNGVQKRLHLSIYQALVKWMHQYLENSLAPRTYLESRGITWQTCQTFEVGFCPNDSKGLQSLIKQLQKDGFLLEDLAAIDFLYPQDGGWFSPFAGRIVFPIKDSLSRCVGFGGRIFLAGDTRPKYYNSKEGQLFIKKKLLFGWHLAKKAMLQQRSAFLVEGYLDCLMMHQHGYINTVATMGTACSQDHLSMLARQVGRLNLLYDADQAGEGAVLKLAESGWDQALELAVVPMPKGYDPAAWLAQYGNLDECLALTMPLFNFYIQSLGNDFYHLDLNGRLHKLHKLLAVLQRVKDGVQRYLLLQQLAVCVQIPFTQLQMLFERLPKAKAVAMIGDAPVNSSNLSPQVQYTAEERFCFLAWLLKERGGQDLFDEKVLEALPDPLQTLVKTVNLNWLPGGQVAQIALDSTLLNDEQRMWLHLGLLRFEDEVNSWDLQQLKVQLLQRGRQRYVDRLKVQLRTQQGLDSVAILSEMQAVNQNFKKKGSA